MRWFMICKKFPYFWDKSDFIEKMKIYKHQLVWFRKHEIQWKNLKILNYSIFIDQFAIKILPGIKKEAFNPFEKCGILEH